MKGSFKCKQICLLLCISFYLFVQCKSTKHCCKLSNYLIKVDTLRPFKVEGIYCLQSIKDTMLNDNGLIKLNIYSRIGGEKIKEGVVWFTKETKVRFSNGQTQISMPQGTYNINVHPFEPHLPFVIKELKIVPNKEIEINCFVGNSLQF